MPHITGCLTCGKLYEEVSEEQANSPYRKCNACWDVERKRLGPPDIICVRPRRVNSAATVGRGFRTSCTTAPIGVQERTGGDGEVLAEP